MFLYDSVIVGSVKKSQRLADAVEARRRELELSPGDLAERSGLSAQALRNVRNGVVRDYQERLTIPLTRALHWSPDSIDRLLNGDDPIELDTPAPTSAGGMDEVNDLIAALRHAATKSDGRDTKLDQIIELCEQVVRNQELAVDKVLLVEAQLEALVEHFGLRVDLVPTAPE